ncbi:hypothetical protein D3C83_204610 [compost metagenome]
MSKQIILGAAAFATESVMRAEEGRLGLAATSAISFIISLLVMMSSTRVSIPGDYHSTFGPATS